MKSSGYLLVIAMAGLVLTLVAKSNSLTLVENQKFSAKVGTSTATIRWVRVPFERLQAICSFGSDMPEAHGSFLACSTREPPNTCVIYTSTDLTHQILGHELRHCFQGNFHK